VKQIKVLSVLGTRPEAVKMAPVVNALHADPAFQSRVCVTAQHREMLDQVLSLFQVTPDIDLNLMKPDQSLSQLTADILTHLDPVLAAEAPDWVLVQGDTTTVMATALAAFYRGIKVGHVEAGLRTGDKRQPFPEEINRRVAGVVADLHFAPTISARDNLLREGVGEEQVIVTGNTVIDALNEIKQLPLPEKLVKDLGDWGLAQGKRKLVLVTAHRRENFGQPIRDICTALATLADRYPDDLCIVYPVHLNPNIQKPVFDLLTEIPQIKLIPPQDYLTMVHLMQRSVLVLTDSGGIQEEATGLGKPTLVLREKTERPEGLQAGVLKLVGSNPEIIVRETSRLLEDKAEYDRMAHSANPFGDGKAAGRILEALKLFHQE
jgi:UDP-N-acetylglucosamine 2-epimerase (non-hydrolysing)